MNIDSRARPPAGSLNARVLFGVLVVAAIALSACGGDDNSVDASKSDNTAKTSRSAPKESADDLGAENEEASETGQIEFLLPESHEPPAGFVMMQDTCKAPSDPDGPHERGVWYPYAVPETWTATGGGSAGSGEEADIDHTFETESGDVTVQVTHDRRDDEGLIKNGSGDSTESFDYTYKVGDKVTEIEYESVMSLTVGDQDVEVMKANPSTASGAKADVEYKVRFETNWYKPSFHGDKKARESLVLVISHDNDSALSPDDVKTIVSSMTLPDCTRRYMTILHESTTNMDFDGDGKVGTAEDYRAILEETS